MLPKKIYPVVNFLPPIVSFLTLYVVFIATTVHHGVGVVTRGCGDGSGWRAEYVPPLVGVVVDGPDSSRQWETLSVIITVKRQRIMEIATLL